MNDLTLYGILFLLLVLVIYLLRLVILQNLMKRKQKKRMALGRKLEKKAMRFLSVKGFSHIEYQKQYSYKVNENGLVKTVLLIPDFTAKMRGKKCIIEVKTGQVAPSIKSEGTRRQLLEYHYAIGPDRLFLLDMGKKELKEVMFY